MGSKCRNAIAAKHESEHHWHRHRSVLGRLQANDTPARSPTVQLRSSVSRQRCSSAIMRRSLTKSSAASKRHRGRRRGHAPELAWLFRDLSSAHPCFEDAAMHNHAVPRSAADDDQSTTLPVWRERERHQSHNAPLPRSDQERPSLTAPFPPKPQRRRRSDVSEAPFARAAGLHASRG